MPGLNYGNSYRITKKIKSWYNKEGVYYGEKIDKWVVRVKDGKGISSIGSYKTENEAKLAFEHFKKLEK